ncbi:bifunctional [glutamate--ammonia ligase]-adenylyl-L-tyrosine phosphorylase/[glutamate--ammonia-ligase] adenylyltransferase [Moraxella sp. VT-16-12]|uniref:bifunctional [glutamate--ammonia ligase]-adenylyl-L-tyrosine phosphorylase/[glutamate--ammonia-ligase] adenylyltransferase n=1 Tax=Moraxella sp. VT-16-12 TaxID=2014877 RepID=UPI000B7DF0E0|nr:bifunctional [glutamate--ammonia ligase]-adenylyl-L-tyrosine phosphorylase/[glutamate--ammonia-ligase] adenylyltransferase [Moraxella sp. VT-16-12]TWV80685.1 bifunctional [glutamate--ammonia ligase]-adenylyl-L-tyrosine phosphorylase/[glutamate--ammonia-ligase] adenylyltransferase [Moraxella sp. VT-16-12]
MQTFTPTDDEMSVLATASPFAMQIFNRHTDGACKFLGRFGVHGQTLLTRQNFDELIGEFIGEQPDETLVMAGLRQLRQYLMLRWIWQDALGAVSLEKLTHELSEFANACLCYCKDFVYANMVQRYGEPMTQVDNKRVCDEFAIIAMGKLGAMELNLSSDIDLIFIHQGAGFSNGKKQIDNQKFMTNLGRGIIKLLADTTEHGFVFRIDMRLRPWGDGSPLVMSLPALQKYFGQHGRTWERFAWLKARLVCWVSDDFYHSIAHIRQTFVHRYYVDYTAFSALREMKQLIMSQQAQRQDLDNIKLGTGGIRDIEFIAQAYALIYGGHHPIIAQNRACLDALKTLAQLDYLNQDEADKLMSAYRFLRRTEHAIQARHDEQSQRLPKAGELTDLAKTLGFDDKKSFLETLNTHRQNVSAPFMRMVTDRQNPKEQMVNADELQQNLATLLSDDSMACLSDFMTSRLVQSLDQEPKSRLLSAYPILLHALHTHACQDGVDRANIATPRLVALLEAIVRRSIYLVMIAENPNATVALIPMLSASPWIARELALHPMLLDNFLQKRYLHLPDESELTDILRQMLLRVEPFDDESYLSAIRTFKKSQVLAVATADILGLRHIMKVSDSLTFIAQVVLSSALRRAFDELVAKHGYPKLLSGEYATDETMGVAIIGYGKLGGIEMSYASDLDVVFLHHIDEKADTQANHAQKSVSGMKLASRMVQKVLNYLTTQTRDGRAYEMDMRLRPSGNAGVMIVSTQAFEIYQTQKAWAWEHQALVRARGIAGDKLVLAMFEKIRTHVLTKSRPITQVQADVLAMRQKMQNHLGTHHRHEFHLKQDFGGLVDIEFLAQFMVLSYAHVYPNLAIWSDNVRIFEEVAKTGLWQTSRCQALTDAYLKLRQKTHELALSDKSIITDDGDWQEVRSFVRDVWQDVIEDGLS